MDEWEKYELHHENTYDASLEKEVIIGVYRLRQIGQLVLHLYFDSRDISI